MTLMKVGAQYRIRGKVFTISRRFFEDFESKLEEISEFGFYNNHEKLKKMFQAISKYATNIPSDYMLYQVDFPIQKNTVEFLILHKSFPPTEQGNYYLTEQLK